MTRVFVTHAIKYLFLVPSLPLKKALNRLNGYHYAILVPNEIDHLVEISSTSLLKVMHEALQSVNSEDSTETDTSSISGVIVDGRPRLTIPGRCTVPKEARLASIRRTVRVEHFARVAITSYPIESASMALTELDLLGDSEVGIPRELEPKKGWIERCWCTNDENVVLAELLDEDLKRYTFD